jgi:hypothetical protein
MEASVTDQKYMRPGLDFAVGKAIEEAGELIASLVKTLRWGWDSYNPEILPEHREVNADWVRREIADVRGALDNLEREMTERLSAGARGVRISR